ncbi:MAG: hypothetical protein QXN26_07465 [Thermoplasmataceae archaeon]
MIYTANVKGNKIRFTDDPWHSPKRSLYDTMPSYCFLDPVGHKFPIMYPREKVIYVGALRAAAARASEYGYDDVYNKAKVLLDIYDQVKESA